MKRNILATLTIGLLCATAGRLAHADTEWNSLEYDLYAGDFDGDGKSDVLYVAKDPSKASGIAKSDTSGPNVPWQSWLSNHLGIPWHGNLYRVIVADYNGDGRSDLFLQRQTSGDHYLLFANASGKFTAISQTISNSHLGQVWAEDQHKVAAGDFNGDSRADLFLQATSPSGTHAVITADANGQFTSGPQQTWTDASWGAFKWSTRNANIVVGDFNGDGRSDLLVQAKPKIVLIDFDVPIPVPTYSPNSFGVALSQGGTTPFQQVGVQQWSRNAFGVDWSPSSSNLLVGDFDGNGTIDVLLQARSAGRPSYRVSGNSVGSIFSAGSALASNVTWSADGYRLLVGNFDGTVGAGVYWQSNSSGGTNYFSNVITGVSVSLTTHNPAATTGVVPASAPGATAGSFAVSNSGAATYGIPIVVPPGIAGVQPELSIHYLSGVGNGLLGVGWTLGGFSVISRCGKTLAQDGSNDAVMLSTADRFCLDGAKLRLTQGTYGVAGSTYQTEMETFSRVTAVGTAGNGPSSFTVEAKDGLQYEYGSTADSRIEAVNSVAPSTPHSWALNKVVDRHGNTMTITYQEDGAPNGSYRPVEIFYTANATAGVSGAYKVVLFWAARSVADQLTGYVAGGMIKETMRLDRIETQYNEPGTGWRLVRKYQLGYNTNGATPRTRLASVQECDRSSNCLAPTVIAWLDGENGWVSSDTVSSSDASALMEYSYPIDIDGDGRDDLVYPQVVSGTARWHFMRGDGAGGFTAPVNTGIGAGDATNLQYSHAQPIDYFSEGRHGLLADVPGYSTRQLLRWNGSGLALTNTDVTVGMTGKEWIGDFDGDGRGDLLYTTYTSSTGTGSFYVQRNAGATSGTAQFATAQLFHSASSNSSLSPFQGATAGWSSRIMDFNGDGRADFIYSNTNSICTTTPCIYLTNWHLLTSTGTSFTEVQTWACILAGATCVGAPLVGDFNGDGLTDIVLHARALNAPISWQLMYGSGTGVAAGPVLSLPADFNATGFTEDYDRDGKTDLFYAPSPTSGSWSVLRATGSGFESAITVPLSSSSANNTIRLLDFDGDGRRDLGFKSSQYRVHKRKGGAADLVAAIADGFGNTVSISYAPLTDSSIYTKGTGAQFPVVDVQVPVRVVKSYTVNDGIGAQYSLTQKYAGLRVHVQGRGSLGFESRESVDGRTGIRSKWTFRQDHPFTGMLSESVTYQPQSSVTMTKVTNDLQQLAVQGGSFQQRWAPYVKESVRTNYEVGGGAGIDGQPISKVATNTTLNVEGNPTTVTTTTTDLTGSALTYSTSTVNTYADTLCSWRGFVTRQTITNVVPNYTGPARVLEYVRDTSNPNACRAYQQITEPDNAVLKVTATYLYDAFGHQSTQTLTAQNVEPRTITIDYGAQGVFPLTTMKSATSTFNHVATRGFDYALGVETSATDPNGIYVSRQLDGFGRPILETRADGTRTDWSYQSCRLANGYCGDSRLRYQVTRREIDATTPGAVIRSSVQRFDAFGRVLYDESQAVSGAYSIVRADYDNQGRLSRRSEPYFSGMPAYFTTISYDLLGRPTQESRPVNDSSAATQTSKFEYRRLVHTFEDANGKVMTKQLNAVGQVVKMTDPAGGDTTYEFDHFGNLRKTTDPAGNPILSDFNIRGFKIQTIDPDMGTWNYTYYPTGELWTQQDAKNQVTTFAYDHLSRPKTRTEPGTLTTFVYGEATAEHNIGRLRSVSMTGGYSELYTYDGLGRADSITTGFDSASYVVNYSYSSATGLPETVTYPTSTNAVANSRFKVKYEYDYGRLKRVRDANSPAVVYWEQVAANSAGQSLDEVYGNGLHTYSDYDDLTGRLGTRSTGTSGQVQDLSYQWDKVGNLLQRQDARLGFTEVFTYDDVNRLKTSTINSVQNLSLTYYANGNINTKSDVGTYTYPLPGPSSVRPHAVTSAGSTSYAYDANGNMTTRGGDAITWTPYNKPFRIQEGANYSEFSYAPDRSRYKQVAYTAPGGSLPSGLETTLYVGGIFEKITKSGSADQYRHYIMAGTTPVAIRTLRSSGANDTRYLHRDHLGSVDTITNESGTVVQRLSYDAFGKRRNAASWSSLPGSTDWTNIAALSHRGFTFHEHLDNLGLIHMNGRVYDPTLGRLISADPHIQAPLMSQSLNRYSYVMNNPLSMIDPTGYSWLSDAWNKLKRWGSDQWDSFKRDLNTIVGIALIIIGSVVPGAQPLIAVGIAVLYSPLRVHRDGNGGFYMSYGYGGFGADNRNAPYIAGSRAGGSPPMTAPPGAVSLGPGYGADWVKLDKIASLWTPNHALLGGIVISESRGTTTIRVTTTIRGDQAQQVVDAVQHYWGDVTREAPNGHKYRLIVSLTVDQKNGAISVYEEAGRDRSVGDVLTNEIKLAAVHDDDFMLELAHEFGHLLGFKDFYRDVRDPTSRRGYKAVAYPGFEDDIMGTGDRVKVEHLMLLIESYKGL